MQYSRYQLHEMSQMKSEKILFNDDRILFQISNYQETIKSILFSIQSRLMKNFYFSSAQNAVPIFIKFKDERLFGV